MPTECPSRTRTTLLTIVLLWVAFYASFTLFMPPLLDDADSVHVEVAREMLLRHDPVTLYANGIRYLEKAPLLYWSMALSMKVLGVSAAAARVPLALAMLALTLLVEAMARRLFHSARAGLYAALILLSSFGMFLFTRITIPDAMVCLWIALAMYCFWRTEETVAPERQWCWGFAAACALNVLTKGLIGVVFPVGIVVLYLLLTRGVKRAVKRARTLHPGSSLLIFLLLAAPWHIAAGLANSGHGQPAPFQFVGGHWIVPLPTDGNVRGWFWFYFMNEHLLRYLNLRVPHDYDTAPLWLFWGLCLVWMMPWSAFGFKAAGWALPWRSEVWRSQMRRHDLPLPERGRLLLVVWAAVVLLFFAFSTRQEYYVLPALPAVGLLVAGWLASRATDKPRSEAHRRAVRRCITVLFLLGAVFAIGSVYFLLHTAGPTDNPDLSQLLQQNPGDYALSMGHFLDLNANAMGLFRLPLTLAALSLFGAPLIALLLQKGSDSIHPVRLFFSIVAAKAFPSAYKAWAGRKRRVHAANLALAAGAFGFLLAAHLGLQTFAPVLTSAQLAAEIKDQVRPGDMVTLHGEYESGSTLGFYLRRNDIHILEGRSSNLWYGSFFPDAPPIFETPESLATKWAGPQRIFLWQSITDPPNQLPALPGPRYILVKSGGKEIVSNQPNR